MLRRSVVKLYPADREDVRRPRVQDKGLVQGDGANRLPFGAEPPSSRDLSSVEALKGPRDVPEGRSR